MLWPASKMGDKVIGVDLHSVLVSPWVELLMPPVPNLAGQGSAAIGRFNVTVNGGPLALCASLMGTSCSNLPIVPNANVLGFGNLTVGVTPAAMVRG